MQTKPRSTCTISNFTPQAPASHIITISGLVQHTTHCWLKMRYGMLLGAAGRLPINNAAFWLYIRYKLAAPGSCRKHDVLAALKISIDELIGVLKLMKWYWNVHYTENTVQWQKMQQKIGVCGQKTKRPCKCRKLEFTCKMSCWKQLDPTKILYPLNVYLHCFLICLFVLSL